MRGYLTIGDKVGYLNTQTGKYKWAEIIKMNEHSIYLSHKVNGQTWRFWEITKDVLDFSKMYSKEFPNKKRIKFK